jgi:hypothetical protein
MPNKTPITQKVKQSAPVTKANNAKYTDQAKKQAKISAGPGVSLAPAGTDMRKNQQAEAKRKAEAFKEKYGSYPTEAFIKAYRNRYKKTPTL